MRYIVEYYYDECGCTGRDYVDAGTSLKALMEALKSLETHGEDEDFRYKLDRIPTVIEIHAPLPLKEGQHPETPPLYKSVGKWTLRWHLLFEAVELKEEQVPKQPLDNSEGIA